MIKVRKRDGRICNFSKEKIFAAVGKAYSAVYERPLDRHTIYTDSAERYDFVVKIVNGVEQDIRNSRIDDTIDVEAIQDFVEQELKKENKRVFKMYHNYRLKRTKSRERNSDLMKRLVKVAGDNSELENIKRSNANVDGDTAMGTMLQIGSEASQSLYLNGYMSEDIATAHERGDIHIHDLDFYKLTETCCQIDLAKLFKDGFDTGHGTLREPQSIGTACALAAIAIQSNQNDQHGGQSVPEFDYYMAPYVRKSFEKNLKLIKRISGKETAELTDEELAWKLTEEQTYQAMEGFIANLNSMHSRAGAQVPFSSINYGTDTSKEGRMVMEQLLLATEKGLGKGETPLFPIQIFKCKAGVNLNEEDPNYDLFKLACRVSATRLFPNFSFLDAPYNKKFLKEDNPDTEIAYMGCRTRTIANVLGTEHEVVTGRGNLSFTSINLPRLAIEAKGNTPMFFSKLTDMLKLVKKQLLERFEVQCRRHPKNYPFLMGQGIWRGSEKLGPNDDIREILRHGSLSIGFIGLAETLIMLTGKHHGEDEEAQKLGLAIVKHMRDFCDEACKTENMNFALIATPAEGLAGRFVAMDKIKYGIIPGVTDKEYYVNSFHVPPSFKCSAYKKLNIEAPYHDLCNGGHISYVEMDADPSLNLEAFIKIIRYMAEIGIGYGAINHPLDSCPKCGHKGVIPEKCPVCGSDEIERLRRITGYLVGTLDRWNDAKRAEERDRVKHA